MSLKYDWFIVVFLSIEVHQNSSMKHHSWIQWMIGWAIIHEFFMSMKCQDEIKIHEIIQIFISSTNVQPNSTRSLNKQDVPNFKLPS